jgi:hypothetical protein
MAAVDALALLAGKLVRDHQRGFASRAFERNRHENHQRAADSGAGTAMDELERGFARYAPSAKRLPAPTKSAVSSLHT